MDRPAWFLTAAAFWDGAGTRFALWDQGFRARCGSRILPGCGCDRPHWGAWVWWLQAAWGRLPARSALPRAGYLWGRCRRVLKCGWSLMPANKPAGELPYSVEPRPLVAGCYLALERAPVATNVEFKQQVVQLQEVTCDQPFESPRDVQIPTSGLPASSPAKHVRRSRALCRQSLLHDKQQTGRYRTQILYYKMSS